jgi:autotransporter-associated beta strand protein
MVFVGRSPSRFAPNRSRQSRIALALAVAAVASAASSMQAADIVKTDDANDLNLGTSWVGGLVPTSIDVALFNSTLTTGATLNLGNPANGAVVDWAGIRLANPAGAIVIQDPTNSMTFNLGVSGIDLSAATQALTINAPFNLTADQSWNVGSASSLTIGGAVNTGTFVLTVTGAGNTTVNSVLSNSGRLVKTGTGTLSLTRQNTYTGNTTVADGKLLLNFGAAGAPTTDILPSTTPLVIGGSNALGTGKATLEVAGVGVVQNVANTAFGSGQNFINVQEHHQQQHFQRRRHGAVQHHRHHPHDQP